MAKLESVSSMWRTFEKRVMPNVPKPSPQHSDMQAAFYAGAICVLGAVQRVGLPDISMSEGEQYLSSLDSELRDFARKMGQANSERN